MPEQEPLLPQGIEVDETPDIPTEAVEEQSAKDDGWGEGWDLKSDGLFEPNFIEMPEKKLLPPPIRLIDGVAHSIDKEPPGFHVTVGVRYLNVDEALKHMANAEPPDSLTIPYLKEKIKANEDWLAAALTKIAEIETVKMVELSDKVRVLEEAAVEPVIEEKTIISKG